MCILNNCDNKDNIEDKPLYKDIKCEDIIIVYPSSKVVLESESWEDVVINPCPYSKTLLY